jgi:EamA domain-containing membrane protein RarD
MSDALEKAEAAVRDAAANTDVLAIVAAVLATQQATQQQPAPAAPPTARRPVGLYVAAGIGGAVALSFLAMAAALLAVAVAVGAVAATVCVLVLRSMLNDLRKGN